MSLCFGCTESPHTVRWQPRGSCSQIIHPISRVYPYRRVGRIICDTSREPCGRRNSTRYWPGLTSHLAKGVCQSVAQVMVEISETIARLPVYESHPRSAEISPFPHRWADRTPVPRYVTSDPTVKCTPLSEAVILGTCALIVLSNMELLPSFVARDASDCLGRGGLWAQTARVVHQVQFCGYPTRLKIRIYRVWYLYKRLDILPPRAGKFSYP